MPCVIFWNNNHFVVLEGFKGKKVYINDPAFGRRKLTCTEFEQSFSGIVLVFAKGPDFVENRTKGRLVQFLRQRIQGEEKSFLLPVAISFLMALPGLLLPLSVWLLVDDILLRGKTFWTTPLMLAMLFCVALYASLHAARYYLLNRLRTRLELQGAYHFFSHILRLPAAFYEQRYTGDLMKRVIGNDRINRLLAGSMAVDLMDLIQLVMFLLVMLMIAPIPAVIAIAIMIAGCGIRLWFNARLRESGVREQVADSNLYGALCVSVNQTDTIKSAGA